MRPAQYRDGRPTVNVTELAEIGFSYARDAALRITNKDDRGALWVFYFCMDKQAREGFMAFLLQTEHPSIYEAGTGEARFKAFAAEYAEAWGKR